MLRAVLRLSPHRLQQHVPSRQLLSLGWGGFFERPCLLSGPVFRLPSAWMGLDSMAHEVRMTTADMFSHRVESPLEVVREMLEEVGVEQCGVVEASLWRSSTVKKRKMKMNKHKLKKRRKLLRMNTKQSRG